SNDVMHPEVYTLSLHDALPICGRLKSIGRSTNHELVLYYRIGSDDHIPGHHCLYRHFILPVLCSNRLVDFCNCSNPQADWNKGRSEEHTSELQSRFDLVCRLLL